eukprot:TRINITY_DN4925_c0_g2_i1.p1 TRINITY_DN4925_c0_g2~~TRINITY_DN4925_c0_g2_i1.p1  ORF type:complete len:168 (-),score=31.33 TRINITY_DN4925_c0_g2_i1:169-672(-)
MNSNTSQPTFLNAIPIKNFEPKKLQGDLFSLLANQRSENNNSAEIRGASEVLYVSAKGERCLRIVSPKTVSKMNFIVIGTEEGSILIPEHKRLARSQRRVSSFIPQDTEEAKLEAEVKNEIKEIEEQATTKKYPVTPPTKKTCPVPMAPCKEYHDNDYELLMKDIAM